MLNYYLLGFKKVFAIFKKFFLVIAVYFIVVSLFAYFINKDKPQINNKLESRRQEIYKIINDPQLNNTEEGKITTAIIRGVYCSLIGEACTNNPNDAEENFHHSFFGFITNLVSFTYTNPPASGVYWAYSSLQNAGFVPKTYAAEGVGFAAIRPFMNIWKVFRDISYMLLVLVLIAVGFMIMFRMKLNPQTVISVENALPKIVIALLLITFSFPIAGFMIDLMYITIGIIAVFFSNVANIPQEFNSSKKILETFYFEKINLLGLIFIPPENLWKLAGSLFGIIPNELKNLLNMIVFFIFPPDMLFSLLLGLIPPLRGRIPSRAPLRGISEGIRFILSHFKTIKEDTNAAGSGTDIVSIIIGIFFLFIDLIFAAVVAPLIGIILIALILLFTLFYLFLRIFFLLLHAYIQIILLLFFAPVILSIEMIPGKSTFSSWIKNLIVNLSTWPILTVLLLINKILMSQSLNSSTLWQPPFLMSINSEYVATIISMGILFMIPDLIKAFKDLLGVKPLPLGLNLGAFTAGAGAAIGGAMGAMSQFYAPYQFLSQGPLKNIFKIRPLKEGSQQVTEATEPGAGAGPATSPPSKQ